MDFQSFVSADYLVLIPVLYFAGKGLKSSSRVKDKNIPIWLGIGSIGLALLKAYILNGLTAEAIFQGITQGSLCAAAAVYADQILKQREKES